MRRVIITFFIFAPVFAFSQNNKKNVEHFIGRMEFDKLMHYYMDSSMDSKAIDPEDAFIMIRLYNTIHNDTSMYKKQPYMYFRFLFIKNYCGRIAALLEATHARHMSLYSRKYDLHIGGDVNENSRYSVFSSQNTKVKAKQRIGRKEFDKLIHIYADTVRNNKLSFEDAFIVIRLFNTVTLDTSVKKKEEPCVSFSKAFIVRYGQAAVNLTDAHDSIGMALYSRKYDLCLGGEVNANSRYRILDK
jgi:hypothetical protein